VFSFVRVTKYVCILIVCKIVEVGLRLVAHKFHLFCLVAHKFLRSGKITLMEVEDNIIKNEKNIVQLDHDKIGIPH